LFQVKVKNLFSPSPFLRYTKSMKNDLILIYPFFAKNFWKPGERALEELIDRWWSFGTFSRIFLFAPQECKTTQHPALRAFYLEEISRGEIFKVLSAQEDLSQTLVFSWLDYPLVDKNRYEEILHLHQGMKVEYTNSDGYPKGLFPELVDKDILPHLKILGEKEQNSLSRDFLFETLSLDINAFDIETLISPEDFRMLRLDFSLAIPSSRLLVQDVQQLGASSTEEILSWVRSRKKLRSLPRSFTFQLKDYCPYKDSFRFLSTMDGKEEIPFATLKAALEEIGQFAQEGVITFALGEPSLYSSIIQGVEEVSKMGSFQLVIETSARGWDPGQLKKIKDISLNNLLWIVEMDAVDPEIYAHLRGEGFQEAMETTGTLLELFPGQVYIQATRVAETEASLEHFYRYWEERKGKVIIQKYNHYSGRRDDQKILDLSPIQREACWHLKRSMVFWANGAVSPCRDDWEQTLSYGKFPENNIQDLWAKGKELYSSHIQSQYPGICEKCDEYYSFHF